MENVAEAIALAATDERAARRIYNVCEQPSFSELEWATKIAAEMGWDGEFVVLPVERTPRHLLKPGNAAQHWNASSARIRRELGYKDPVGIEQAVRQTIRWEQDNPPEVAFLAQFDYAAEDAALAAGSLKHIPRAQLNLTRWLIAIGIRRENLAEAGSAVGAANWLLRGQVQKRDWEYRSLDD